MSSFDEREAAFENKYAHDKNVEFKIAARSNKLLGLWAADLLGKSGDAAEAYAKEVVISDFEEAGKEDVFRKLSSDLGIAADESKIREQMAACLIEAKRQVMEEE